MIRFFRVNDPYRLVFVLIILIIIRITYGIIGLPLSLPEMKFLLLGEWLNSGFSMYSEAFDYTAPLSAWTYSLLDFLFGRSRTAHWVISSILIFTQALLFNRSMLKNKIFSESNYVPAFLYVIFSVSTFDFFALSPQLMSLTFVVVSMDHLIRRMDNEAGDELFLFPGFYLGVAALFYFPAAAFFIVFLLALIVITRAQLRRIMLFIFGYVASFTMVISLLIFNGSASEFWDVYFVELFREKIFYFSYSELLIWTIYPAVFFLLALINALGKREGSLHAKTQQFMFLVFLASLGVVLMSGTLYGSDLLFFIPVFTFFISNYILKIRKKFWRFIVSNLLIVSSLMVPYVGLRIDRITDGLLVKDRSMNTRMQGKRIMIIGPLSPAYLQGAIASPFIDKQISKEKLEGLDYYHTAPLFLRILKESNPEIIIDQWNQIPKMEERFPEMEEHKYEVLSQINN